MLHRLARLAILGALGIAALFAALWIEHRTALELPPPTGPLAVGRTLFDWVEDTATDNLAPRPGTPRELLAWIWYPAEPGPYADDYIPASARAPGGLNRGPLPFRLLTRDLSKVRGHSLPRPDVSRRQPSYPVAILRAGATLGVVNYSTLAEDLASHGYVVVGLDAPYRTMEVVFPDGRVIARTPENNPELVSGEDFTRLGNKLLAAWTADIGFVLDRLANLNAADPAGKFTGRLDLGRVGVFGHSFGGAQAAQFCHADSRCTAGIDIDGALVGSVIPEGIHKPFLFLFSGEGDFSSDAEVRRIKADIQSVYDRLPANGKLRMAIRGANHFTFTDDGALLKSALFRGLLRVFGRLKIDGRRQLAVTAYGVRTFFDAYLKGNGGSTPKIASPLYPELEVLE